MIDAREEHANIWYNMNVLHAIELIDSNNRFWPGPHVNQMQHIQHDATHQTDFHVRNQAHNQTDEPSDKITAILTPQMNR